MQGIIFLLNITLTLKTFFLTKLVSMIFVNVQSFTQNNF